jgi:uncharacterized C2H2 Zn-finger protein
MAEPKDSISKLAGFQSEIRCTSALQVRIAYQSPRYEYFMRSLADDWLFSFASRKGQWNSGEMRESTNLNPYAIRREFEAIDLDRPEMVVRFLSEAGRFWPWDSIRLSQLKEWREFLKWLRIEPHEAKKTLEGEKAWNTATLNENYFFAASDLEFTRARYPLKASEKMKGSEHWRRIVLQDRETLAALRRFAHYPQEAGGGSQVKLHWYDPEDWLPQQKGIPPEDWEERHKKTPKGRLEPYLRIHAVNILEALAATIYADRLDGQRFGKCKHCGEIFKIQSDHGQQFCPSPPHLQSSPCKNAYMQHKRREKARKEKHLT